MVGEFLFLYEDVSMIEHEKSKQGLAVSQVVDVASLVQYNDGAVVSRILMKNEAGTVTLFSFDQGQILSEHTAPFDALVHVIDGQAEFIIGGKTFELSAGQMILMPADIPHAVNAVKRFKMVLTMLKKK